MERTRSAPSSRPRTEQDARPRKRRRKSRVGVARFLELVDDGMRQHERQDLIGVPLLVAGPQNGGQPMEVRDFLIEDEWERSLFVRTAHGSPLGLLLHRAK